MPSEAARDAPIYSERLSVPARWWLIAAAGVAVGAAEIFAGFNWQIALIVYAALALPVTALLLAMSSTTISVDAGGLHAGGRTLRLAEMSAAAVLDADETRRWLGPGADPAAYVVARGFVRRSVLIRLVDPSTTPYWLVSSRHPDELLAALVREPQPEPGPVADLS